MTTSTLTIADFLLARIADDEAVAEAASDLGASWTQVDPVREHGRIEAINDVVTYDEGRPTQGQAPHIARHDPARVLAECKAKRTIIASEPANVSCSEAHPMMDVYHLDGHGPGPVLRALAAVYADHPGYRSEWA